MSTDNTVPTEIFKVAKVVFSKDIILHRLPDVDDKVIMPLRLVKVITVNGEVWHSVQSAFVTDKKKIIALYLEKRDVAFKKVEQQTT